MQASKMTRSDERQVDAAHRRLERAIKSARFHEKGLGEAKRAAKRAAAELDKLGYEPVAIGGADRFLQ